MCGDATLLSQVAPDPMQLCPHLPDGLHAGLHHSLLQLGGDEVEPLARGHELGVLTEGHDALEDLVAGQHERADDVHQLGAEGDVEPGREIGRATG